MHVDIGDDFRLGRIVQLNSLRKKSFSKIFLVDDKEAAGVKVRLILNDLRNG
jgi:hypothetical protein